MTKTARTSSRSKGRSAKAEAAQPSGEVHAVEEKADPQGTVPSAKPRAKRSARAKKDTRQSPFSPDAAHALSTDGQGTREIVILGANEHNLKNINVRIPRDKMVVITGISGSGKSTLAFDTIYAEGQRKYVESLSAYARQFLAQLAKPDVSHI